jgi:hypothetical protein
MCLIDPGLRFFPNMALHSNDAAYFPLASCKKLKTFNDRFAKKCPKPGFLTLNPP